MLDPTANSRFSQITVPTPASQDMGAKPTSRSQRSTAVSNTSDKEDLATYILPTSAETLSQFILFRFNHTVLSLHTTIDYSSDNALLVP